MWYNGYMANLFDITSRASDVETTSMKEPGYVIRARENRSKRFKEVGPITAENVHLLPNNSQVPVAGTVLTLYVGGKEVDIPSVNDLGRLNRSNIPATGMSTPHMVSQKTPETPERQKMAVDLPHDVVTTTPHMVSGTPHHVVSLKCNRCQGVWQPRTGHPIKCPRCQSKLWNK